jgi:hypothetical protein
MVELTFAHEVSKFGKFCHVVDLQAISLPNPLMKRGREAALLLQDKGRSKDK